MICALMIGRERSTGFPGKNTYPVLGRPMMSYGLMAARASAYVDAIHVSTDSERIKAVAREYGAAIIERPPELCTKEALGEEAFVHGYRYLRDHLSEPIEAMVLLFCNAPTLLAHTIDQGIEVLRIHPDIDSAVTVSVYNMWSPFRARRIDADGLLRPFVPLELFGNITCDRDSQGDVYFADMSVSIVRPDCLERLEEGLLPQRWMGQRIYPLVQWGGCDVDYEWQVPAVEFWLSQHGFTHSSTPYPRQLLPPTRAAVSSA